MFARRSKRYDFKEFGDQRSYGSGRAFCFSETLYQRLIVSQEKSFRHAHIHLTEYEMTRRMAEAVSEDFRLASSVLNTFLKTREEPVADPVETIRKIAEARRNKRKTTILSTQERSCLLTCLLMGDPVSVSARETQRAGLLFS
jgi:hypothetical protein